MRLTSDQIRLIRDATREVFGPEARVRLFGSRLDAAARGGDIDLLVECDRPVAERVRKSLRLSARLQQRLGDRGRERLVAEPRRFRRGVVFYTGRQVVPFGPDLTAVPLSLWWCRL